MEAKASPFESVIICHDADVDLSSAFNLGLLKNRMSAAMSANTGRPDQGIGTISHPIVDILPARSFAEYDITGGVVQRHLNL